MIKKAVFSTVFIFLAVLTLSHFSEAKQALHENTTQDSADKTLSPYFFVKSDDPGIDQLPLKSTSATVNISGVIADVGVTQVYKNNGKKPLEAIYVFPVSTRAAVYGMKMTIGERVIIAKIKKREEARQEYEQAKQQGKSASLLEQQRPNVFQMNVANIMPGDTIKVELKYTELLISTDREYEFIYPTVVGPRYSNEKAETAPSSEKWSQNPYLHQGKMPVYTFDISVNLSGGMPVQKIYCPSHKVNISYNGSSNAFVNLDKSDKHSGNKDFILKYQLAGRKVESGLLLYDNGDEKFFLLMIHPPKKITSAEIPGREYIFIVDVSGSMYGFPLDISKKLLKDLIANLRPSDKFNVLLFSGGSSVMSQQSLSATSENISKAINLIENQQGGGGTEVLSALKNALSLPKARGYSRTVVIVTDGYVTVEEEAFDFIRKNLDDANMFAFGIGSSVNRHIIEGIAHVGMGEPFIITKPEEAPAKAEAFRKMIQSPVLTNIKVDFNSFKTYDIEPISIPDVLAERPVILFGKWKGALRGNITISGLSGRENHTEVIDVSRSRPSKHNSSLRFLWARHRITMLSDYNMLRNDDKRIKEVTDLGLKYNLLTKYTSFVAVDNEVRNKNGNSTTVKQPLPLPEGVSNYAVGSPQKTAPMSIAPAGGYGGTMFFKGKSALKSEDALLEQAKEIKDNRQTSLSRIKINEITVSDNSLKEDIKKIIQKNSGTLDICFKKASSKGKIKIKIVINPNGSVKDVDLISGEINDKGSVQCILKTITSWQFSDLKLKKEVVVTVILSIQKEV